MGWCGGGKLTESGGGRRWVGGAGGRVGTKNIFLNCSSISHFAAGEYTLSN